MDRVHAASGIFETTHCSSSTLGFHRHDDAYATIVIEGSYTEVRDGARTRRCTDDVLIVHASGETHADHFDADVRCLNVELPFAVPHSMLLPLAGDLRGLAVRLRSAARNGDRKAIAHGAHALQDALAEAVKPRDARVPDWLGSVLARFDWHGDAPLHEAAALAGVHPVQFSRAFHRHVQTTPQDYRARLRVERASEHLLASTASLAWIASECGFADQSHFTRVFGRATGMSPARFRRAFAG